jgi:hypothetical protein
VTQVRRALLQKFPKVAVRNDLEVRRCALISIMIRTEDEVDRNVG